MVSCKKTPRECFKKFVLAPASSRSASEKKIAISRISHEVFPQPRKTSAVHHPSLASETPTVFCLRRKTRWTWSSCLHEQSAQEHIEESCTFVDPISLTLNRLTWTSDTAFFPGSSNLQLHARRIQCSDENAQQYVDSHLAYTILVLSSDWMTVMCSPNGPWSGASNLLSNCDFSSAQFIQTFRRYQKHCMAFSP